MALLLSPCYVVSGFLLSWAGQCPSPRKHAVPASPSLRSLASVGPARLLVPLTADCNLDRVVGLHFGAPSSSLPCSSWLSHPHCRWSCSRGHGDVPARSEGGSCPISPFLSAPLFLNRSLKHRLLVVWLRRRLPAFEGACSSPGSLGVRPWPRGSLLSGCVGSPGHLKRPMAASSARTVRAPEFTGTSPHSPKLPPHHLQLKVWSAPYLTVSDPEPSIPTPGSCPVPSPWLSHATSRRLLRPEIWDLDSMPLFRSHLRLRLSVVRNRLTQHLVA